MPALPSDLLSLAFFKNYSYIEQWVPDLPRSFLPGEIMIIKGEKLQMEEAINHKGYSDLLTGVAITAAPEHG